MLWASLWGSQTSQASRVSSGILLSSLSGMGLKDLPNVGVIFKYGLWNRTCERAVKVTRADRGNMEKQRCESVWVLPGTKAYNTWIETRSP